MKFEHKLRLRIRKLIPLALGIVLLLFLAGLVFFQTRSKGTTKARDEVVTKTTNPQPNFITFETNTSNRPDAPHLLNNPKLLPSDSELQIAIPSGAKLPAAFMDAGNSEDSDGVRELLLSFEKEFQDDYEAALRLGISAEEAWEGARLKSDERYRALFGEDAYLEALNLAAEEVMTDSGNTAKSPRL